MLPKENEQPILSGVTDENGILNLGGLPFENATSYYLYETHTLPGYNLLSGPVIISESGNGKISAYLDKYLDCEKVNGVWEITVYNSTGVELPETGGTTPIPLYIIGSVLLFGAACGLILKRKKR